jgi:hypothetical protein
MRMTISLAAVLTASLGWGGLLGAAQSERVLQLSFEPDGRVSLRAQHVTTREILAEWARLCGCHLVNADGMRGDPVAIPLLFEHQPQAVVLNSLLRQAAGYVLTPRRLGVAGPSEFETIYIVPTSNPTTGTFVAGPQPMASPVPLSTAGSPDNEIPPVPEAGQPAANVPAPGARPAGPGAPGTGLPSLFVPIVPVQSSPFTTPSPSRGGGPGPPTPATPPPGTPGQPQVPPTQPGGTVGANP